MHRDRSSQRESLLLTELDQFYFTFSRVDYKELNLDGAEVELKHVSSISVEGIAIGYLGYHAYAGDLVCLVSEPEVFHLCNPQTGQSRALYEPFESYLHCEGNLNIGFVFGYMSPRSEYVVVTISRFWSDSDTDDDDDDRVASLWASKFCFTHDSINSACWKEIEENCPCAVEQFGVVVGNSSYWVAAEKDVYSVTPIVTLDLVEDKFQLIAGPQGWNPKLLPGLIGLKEKLYVIDNDASNSGVLVIWGLNKSNEPYWVKDYEVKLDFPAATLPRTSSKGVLIVELIHMVRKYYILDPETGSVRLVFHEEFPFRSSLGFYWRSFFPLGKTTSSVGLDEQEHDSDQDD
ncbi:OLC1v1000026C1 [Oldenlandia corymbosa var. corymbosa]|nr:OLC1v1000026C1 [Oldenlandia corymbosa var. corymbosa]